MRVAIARAVPLILIAATCAGCFGAFVAGAAGGAAGAIYVKGRLIEVLEASVGEVHMASREALLELGLPIIEDAADASSAKLRSEYADGRRVWVDIRAETPTTTKITIRTGPIRDWDRANDVLSRVKRNL